MPFDPTKPAANSPVSSQELRDQFNSLNDKIDGVAGGQITWTDLEALRQDIYNESAQAIPNVQALEMAATQPPTDVEVQAIIDKLNELIAALKRT